MLTAVRRARRTVAAWRSTTDPGDWDHRAALTDITATIKTLLPAH